MITIPGKSYELCDGVTRRDFLRLGALGMGGLALPDLLRAEAAAGLSSKKSVIMIYLAGGPPHQDTFDLKMDAPSEIRGPFKPINTNVSGIQICEHFPSLAKIMDKVTILRSIVGADGDHSPNICFTGRSRNSEPEGGWPSIGAVTSKLQGAMNVSVPSFVGLAPDTRHAPYGWVGSPGYLGDGYKAFRPQGEALADMKLNGITASRLDGRRKLLAQYDELRRKIDKTKAYEGADAITQQALSVLTAPKLAQALDLSNEDPKVIARYGKGNPAHHGDGAPRDNQQFLMARRLVEAGARVVTLNYGRWDFHHNAFSQGKVMYPMFDQGFSALIEDLHERGLDKDVAVIAWGEFGRSPKIGPTVGRDHWPQVSCGLMAGGGMTMGQVIGSTDRLGGEADSRPVHFGEVHATLYKHLGIEATKTVLHDMSDRPHPLVDSEHHPIPELI